MRGLSTIIIARLLIDALTPSASPVIAPLIALTPEGKGALTVTAMPRVLGSVPRGGQRLPLLTLNLAASCEEDVSLTSITVRHTGRGRTQDIARVYAFEGLRRISTATTFDASTGYATLRFRKYVLPKCSAMEMTIAVDLTQTAEVASEHGVMVRLPSDIQASAKEVSLHAEQEESGSRITPWENGGVTVRLLSLHSQRLRFGMRETVARLQLTSDALHDYYVKSVTLKNEGTARDYDLVRLELETRSGEKLTPYTHHMDASTVTMEFSPWYELPRSTTVVLLLKAEVRAGIRRTVQFTLQEPSDLLAVPKR